MVHCGGFVSTLPTWQELTKNWQELVPFFAYFVLIVLIFGQKKGLQHQNRFLLTVSEPKAPYIKTNLTNFKLQNNLLEAKRISPK